MVSCKNVTQNGEPLIQLGNAEEEEKKKKKKQRNVCVKSTDRYIRGRLRVVHVCGVDKGSVAVLCVMSWETVP